MKSFIFAAATLFAIAASPAHAVTCAAPGAVNMFNTKGGFLFYPSRSYGDAVFKIPGAAFAKDAGAPPGSTQFSVDGIAYQFLTVPKAGYLVPPAVSDDAAILARHARQQHQYAINVGSPLTVLDDVGNRAKAAARGSPAFLFKHWRLSDPKQTAGASQFMLSTVVGDEVALLSAMVPSPADEQKVMAAFDVFSSSYRLLQSKKDCPKLK